MEMLFTEGLIKVQEPRERKNPAKIWLKTILL